MGEVVSFFDYKLKKTKLKSNQPYCGVCYDNNGDINFLMHVPLQDKDGTTYHGWFCIECENEFD